MIFRSLLFPILLTLAPAALAEYNFPEIIQPAPASAKFEDPGFIVWCGTVVRDEKGKCHLFYSRWPRKLGHYAWVTHSEVAHAVADHPLGPYRFAGVALPARGSKYWDGHCTHNPTVMRFDGKYYLYYMGNTGDGKAMTSVNWSHRNNQRIGVAVADSPSGPWTRSDTPLIAPTPGFHDAHCLANPSVTRRPDGGYLMVYKAVGDKGPKPFGGPVVHVVATSESPTGPFKKLPDPVFTSANSSFAAEDPFIWYGPDRYWAIVKDFAGNFTRAGVSLALFESADGLAWKPAAHPLVSTLDLKWEDGSTQKLMKLERPQLLLEDGKPSVLFCAAAPDGRLDDSFNVQIPLKHPARETSAVLEARSLIEQPYEYVSHGSLSGPEIPESPDPLVAYRWKEPRASDDLQIYVLSPSAVSADREESFGNLQSLTGKEPKVIVKGTGAIRVDFGVESAAWVEFDSPDCPGHVEMSISEYNEPYKTRAPVKYGNTWRLELNRELYEGVRFAWIHVKSADKPWHITGIRAVCQVKPTNYTGSFSCSDPILTKSWYMSAYSVKASLCKDYFGAILMDRGDRMSWTGDAHPIQAAALVAFANHDFIRKNIENTSGQDNGIRSYALYWVLSLLDYYRYTGDAAALKSYMDNACAKLDSAYAVFGQDPPLRFYGWDERLCAGFELWFKPAPEAQLAYKMLSIRAWSDFAKVMGEFGRTDLRDKYNGYAMEKMAELRKSDSWTSTLGLHSAADAINTGHLTKQEQDALFEKLFRNRVNRLSFSPFNQYFIIQAMARMGKHDDALSTVRDIWGGMLQNGATTPYEVFHPSWNEFLGPNDRVPNSQSGVTSLCHPWGAGVVKWLNEEILGIVPTQPGFKAYDILPHPGRTLTQVSGETPTPLGTILANFDFASGRCHVSAPQGCIGRVGIPKLEKTIAKIMINGTLAWDGSHHAVPGIGGGTEDAEFVVFTGVQPGTYDFVVDYRGTTPAYDEPAVEYVAESLKPDTTTGGNWGGVYGKEGHILCNYHGEGRDEKQLPAYVKSLDYFRAFPKTKNCVPDPVVWANDTSDKRALARNARNDPERNATGYSNPKETMTITIGIDGPRDYQVALYFVDWKKQGSRQVVEMIDADSLNPIAPVRMVSDHSDGIYLIYKYDRSVKFRINKVRGDVSSLSGIFFDQASPVSMIKDSTIKQP